VRKERKKENGYAETKRQEKALDQGALRVPGNFDDRLLSGGDPEPGLMLFLQRNEQPGIRLTKSFSACSGFSCAFFYRISHGCINLHEECIFNE
jgi:hypothetical protein